MIAPEGRSDSDAQTKAVALIPPRPNPGPEPLEAAPPAWPWALGVGVGLGLLGLISLRLALRRKAGTTSRGGVRVPPEVSGTVPSTTRDEMAALSLAVKETLAARFDATWRAKTTEEVASSPGLADAFGGEEAERLVAFLRAADLVKFAPTGPDRNGDGLDPQREALEAWLGWASRFVEAGARSKIKGK